MAVSLDEADRFGIRHDETTGPDAPSFLDGVFGHGRVTAAGRRVLEADPGVMDLLEGVEVVRVGLGGSCWPPGRTVLCEGLPCW